MLLLLVDWLVKGELLLWLGGLLVWLLMLLLWCVLRLHIVLLWHSLLSIELLIVGLLLSISRRRPDYRW